MYSDKRAFKRDELQWELRDEDAEIGAYNPYNSKPIGRKPRSPYVSVNVGVAVNGKYWKSMPYNQAVKAASTLRAKGNEVEIKF
jgi:hypothetical protein